MRVLIVTALCLVVQKTAAYSRGLPDWYEENRVQAHSRLSLRQLPNQQFELGTQRFRETGVTVFTRHTKTGAEEVWWPSAYSAIHPYIIDSGRNLLPALNQRIVYL